MNATPVAGSGLSAALTPILVAGLTILATTSQAQSTTIPIGAPGRANAASPRPEATASPAAPTANVTAPVKDYAKGFQQFYKLGLPDAAKAQYVNVSAYSQDLQAGGYMGGLYELRLAGNGWMLEETPKVRGKFIIGNCQVLEVYDQAAIMKERMKKWQESQKTNQTQAVEFDVSQEDDGKTAGQWKKADAAKDVAKILTFLKGKSEKSGRYDQLQYSGGYGTLFLGAVHFHRNGFTNEANEIVGLLFQTAGDPRKVIAQAMNQLADSRYNGAYSAFVKQGDWNALGKELDGLLATFAASWKKAPAVKRLADRVRQQLAQTQVPGLPGDGLTDEDKALALELAAAVVPANSAYMGYGYGELWILPSPVQAPRRLQGSSEPKDNILSRIRKRGMKSVPLLMAMLKDDYLTKIDMRAIGASQQYESYGSGDEEVGDAQVDAMYNTMRRPASRSDIAMFLLSPLLPRKEEEGRRQEKLGRDELSGECRTWYEANKDKAPLDLARAYFSEGSRQQQQYGMQYLLKKGTETDMAAIEKHFLESPQMFMNSGSVHQYVQTRGEKAKAFLEKYEARLNEQIAAGSNEMFKDEGFKTMARQQMKALKDMISSKPAKELLEEVVAGTKTIAEVSQHLYQGLSREKTDALTLILDAAIRAKDPGTTRDLVQMAAYARHVRAQQAEMGSDEGVTGEGEPPSEPPASKPEDLQIAKHADQWKNLLADTRKLDTMGAGSPSTVGDIAAMTIDALYGMQPGQPIQRNSYTALGQRARGIHRARAEALLAGKKGSDLPQFPSLEDITDELKKAVAEKIMKCADASLETTISALSLNEQAALAAAARKDAKLNLKLAPAANKVRNVSGDATLAAELKDMESAKGKPLDKGATDKLFTLCRKLTAEGKVIRFAATRSSCLDGIDIVLTLIQPQGKEYSAMVQGGVLGGADQVAEVSGTVADSACQAAAVWPLATPPPAGTLQKAAPANEDDRQLEAAVAEVETDLKRDSAKEQTDFWKSVEEFCAGKGNVCSTGVIMFFGKPIVKDAPATAPESAKTATPVTINVDTIK